MLASHRALIRARPSMLLQWVRRNVRGFGGNRDRVTVWGQGSGALAVAALATNPSTFQLYHVCEAFNVWCAPHVLWLTSLVCSATNLVDYTLCNVLPQ